MKRILIINSDPFHNGPRMIREIDILKNDFEIIAFGRSRPHDKSLKFININLFFGFTRLYGKIYKRITKKYYNGEPVCFKIPFHILLFILKPDIIINHNPVFFPSIFSFPQKKFKVVYNAHEYHPLQMDQDLDWLKTVGEYYLSIYKKYLNKIDLFINVCESISEKCKSEFNCDSIVIPNAASYDPNINPIFKEKDKLIKIIHHGASIRGRKLETMIMAAGKFPDKYTFDLMLVPIDKEYYNHLIELSRSFSNVRIIKQVNFSEIIYKLNDYDLGLYILPPTSFNNQNALPNKVFEFIQARLALLVSPNIEMKNLVTKHNVGLVLNDYDQLSLESSLNVLDHDMINIFKSNSNKAANIVNAENYYSLLLSKIKTLLPK
jgi:hypothetical protein